MAHRHCHGILVIPVSPLFASVLRQSPYYSKLTTTSTFSVLILLIAETDNSSRFFRVLFFSLLISLFTSFAMLSISSLDDDDIDDVDESDDAVEFDDDEERFDVLFRAFMSSSTVP